MNKATAEHNADNIENNRALPKGWRWVRLGEICQIKGGKRLPQSADFSSNKTNFPYIRVVDFQNGTINLDNLKYLDEKVQNQIARYIISCEDVYISIAGTIGLVGVVPEELGGANLTENAARIIIQEKNVLSRDFLVTFLQSPVGQDFIKLRTNVVGQPKLALERIATISIPLPPLPEQKRIAAILNEQIAAVEKARTTAEAQLEAAKALPAAYLRSVFNSPEAQKWPKKQFGEVAILQRGYDLPSQDQIKGKYPIMTSSGRNGTHSEFKAKGPGVVTGRSGSIGKVFYVNEDYWPHNTALYLKDFKGNEPRFLFYLLQWLDLKSVCSGTGVPTLDRKQVHQLITPFPPLIEQKRITVLLDEQMPGIEKICQTLKEQLDIISKLPAALLGRAFNGEL